MPFLYNKPDFEATVFAIVGLGMQLGLGVENDELDSLFIQSFSNKKGLPAGMPFLGVGKGGANIQLKNNSKRR